MERVGEHPVAAGPLAVRWLGHELAPARAGVVARARIALENAGSATWRSRGRTGVRLAYHWLDPLGNALVWDGLRTTLPYPVAPGEAIELEARIVAPRPPGRYVLSFDLVEEYRFWFAEVGSATLDVPVEVAPRIAERLLAVVVHGGDDAETSAALAAQEEPIATEEAAEAVAHIVPGALPAPDWSRRLLDAHAEGWPAVGGAVLPLARRERAMFAPWAPGGRNPRFGETLLFPSLLADLEPDDELGGFPAYDGDDALFEGRAVVRLRPRSGRPPA
jgi:hypothetical protein